MNKFILATFVSLFFLYTTIAQSSANKDELLKQRQNLQQEIEETEKILKETRGTTKVNVGQLNTINKRIDLQDNVIENIAGQLKFIETDISKSQKEVTKLAKVLDTLKQEYAKSMVYAYKTRNNYDFLNFIFSSSNFNDAIKRVTYLKSYRTYREMQGDNILRTQNLLQQRIDELSGNKQKKNQVLQEKSKEMTVLEKQQQEKLNIVSKLKGRQKELASQISNKRRQDAKLKSLITIMISVFLGKQEQMEDILAVSDLFLLPSEYESFGLAALEAMAAAVPVISTNAGGLPEININDYCGFLSQVGDVEDMCKNSLLLLTDNEKHNQFKKNAVQQAMRFDINTIVPNYEELYNKFVS